MRGNFAAVRPNQLRLLLDELVAMAAPCVKISPWVRGGRFFELGKQAPSSTSCPETARR